MEKLQIHPLSKTSCPQDQEAASASASSDVEESDGGGIREHRENGGTTPEERDDHDKRWSGRTLTPSQIIKEVFFWQLVALMSLDNMALIYVTSLYKVRR